MRFPRPSASWRVLTMAGAALAVLVALAGRVVEERRFGGDWPAVSARVEREVKGLLDAQASLLRRRVARVRGAANLPVLLGAGRESAGQLYEALRHAEEESAGGERAFTVFGADGTAVAWTGRPSPLPGDRLAGPAALFVAPGALGLRLVHVEPVVLNDPGRASSRRVGSLAAEQSLSPSDGPPSPTPARYLLETSMGRVALRPRFEGAGTSRGTDGLLLRAASGETLVEVEVLPAELSAARTRWREGVRAITFGVLTVTVLVAATPLFEWRRRARTQGRYLLAFSGLVVSIGLARATAWLVIPSWWRTDPALVASPEATWVVRLLERSAADLLLSATTLAALVALLAGAVHSMRVARRARRRDPAARPGLTATFLAVQVLAGFVAVALAIVFQRFLWEAVRQSGFDVLHLALHPWDVQRLAVIGGLLAAHAALAWSLVLVFIAATIPWRVPRRSPEILAATLAGWVGPAIVLLLSGVTTAGLPRASVLITLVVAAATAWLGRRAPGWYRHGSQALRLGALLVAMVVPALLLYPSLAFFSDRHKQLLVEDQHAVEAMRHPAELHARLTETMEQVDREPALVARIAAIPVEAAPQTDAAFLIWRQTALAVNRLTSGIELYDATGRLVSRFALNFPEYVSRTPRYQATRCQWEVFGEAAPFGAEERRMLHAERGICDGARRIAGTIVVHVMPDYDVLPFISSQNPYLELFRGARPSEGRIGEETGLVIYGWGRTVMYNSTGRAWVLDDALFSRIYQSRTPFWVTLDGGERLHRVFFANDRFGIYALDYPAPALFDHFVHLAELTTLAALAFLGLVLVAGLGRRLVWRDTRAGHRLLREFRTSFYRKLFLAFVVASVGPVLVLAVLTRTYVAGRLRADVEAEAARTVAVAQGLIEETLAVQSSGEQAGTLNDDLMIWASRVLTQDVNVFRGSQLVATSQRDLFASGLLPTRVPAPVYHALVLQRLPGFVGEERIGQFRYLMAAAPVPAAGRDTVLTVPLASRQREIERETDELDRGVQLGVIVFILVGAGIGFWMAERIGDPVQRLTRASRRIASGDLDARVFVRSADELQRLVESFNSMAFELKRQRAQLERTNRLEAWADMARQVAHEIKNPLTPIQLSAEHLRRVHRDKGVPLGPVLDACVDTILDQVRLLRQIAAEFSSFATTPSPRPEATDVSDLLGEVVRAYATGLADRVRLSLEVADGLPALVVDKTLVGRAVINVIENGLHAMPGGGRMTIRAWQEQDAIVIAVADTGVGMDERALARLFEPYFSTKATGTGLGLTIARRNVELHGGTITVESRRGEGTTVTLRFPIAAAPSPQLEEVGNA